MIKIGLVGCGRLGGFHLRLLKEIPDFEVTGVYDIDEASARSIAEPLNVPVFTSFNELLAASEAIDIVTPTRSHYALARQALQHTQHLFVEKPLVPTPEEAKTLVNLAAEARVVGQVGHIERFNPALQAVRASGFALSPLFIECHRLAEWNPRGADVSVVLDLMIHDIDVIRSIVQSPVRKISANGVAVITDSPDVANARIDFHNGCVANLTASRVSLKNMRKMRFFQKNAYVTIDFLDKQAAIFHIENESSAESPTFTFEFADTRKYLRAEVLVIPEINALKQELTEFARAIKTQTEPAVSFWDGYEALLVAQQIIEKLNPY